MGVVLPDVIELARGLTEIELRLSDPLCVFVALALTLRAARDTSDPLEPPLFKLAGQCSLAGAGGANEIQDV